MFSCIACQAQSEAWSGMCHACGRRNTMIEGAGIPSPMMGAPGTPPVYGYNAPYPPPNYGAQLLPSLNTLTSPAPPEIPRLKTGIEIWDHALSGGMVIGSKILIAGEAGVGKTTLLLNVCAAIAKPDFRTIYLTSEQDKTLLLHRAREVGAVSEHFEIASTQDLPAALAKCRSGFSFAVFDSIQEFDANPKEFTAPATRVFVSRINKQGVILGRTDQEHDPDVLLIMTYASHGDDLREIKANKNRYGACGAQSSCLYTVDVKGLHVFETEKPKRGKRAKREEAEDE
jgi:DNA repair protein RadA/Sms